MQLKQYPFEIHLW